MGDPTNAQDFLGAVTDLLTDLGTTREIRITTYGSIDPANAGAGRPQSTTDYNVEAIIYDFDDRYLGAPTRQRNDLTADIYTIQRGDRLAILSIDPLSASVIDAVLPNAKLVDGSDIYSIIKASPVEIAGEKVTIILWIRK